VLRVPDGRLSWFMEHPGRHCTLAQVPVSWQRTGLQVWPVLFTRHEVLRFTASPLKQPVPDACAPLGSWRLLNGQ